MIKEFFFCLSCSFETPLPAKKVHVSFHSPSMDEEDLEWKDPTQHYLETELQECRVFPLNHFT